MKQRIFYEVDPHNRLIIKKTKDPSNVKRFRQVVYGQFKTDGRNKLYYEIFKSSLTDTPQKIEFTGTYSLDKNHNLIFTLDKWNNQYAGNRLRLKTALIDADGSEMVFLLSSRAGEREKSVYTMRLHGAWQVDKNNRLTFGIRKEDNKTDNLSLFNAWKIGKGSEIEYSYGGRDFNTITLKGHWDIKDKHRIGYILDKRIGPGLDFRASLGRVVSKNKKTYLKFDVIIDISKRKRIRRKIIFSGEWKLNRHREILLEISPGSQKNIALKFKKEILDQRGIAYIESFLKDKERYLGGGLAFRW